MTVNTIAAGKVNVRAYNSCASFIREVHMVRREILHGNISPLRNRII